MVKVSLSNFPRALGEGQVVKALAARATVNVEGYMTL